VVSQLRRQRRGRCRVAGGGDTEASALDDAAVDVHWPPVDGVFWYTKHVHYTLVWI
jgi:hypothetical protein